MKTCIKILISLFILYTGFGVSFAQNIPDECSAIIKTTEPTYLVWDWRVKDLNNWKVYRRTDTGPDFYQERQLYSPFFQTSEPNLNLTKFLLVSEEPEMDYHPEDGWELLVRNFGEPLNTPKNPRNPFFVLYNRYQGLMRVFLYTTYQPFTGVNGAEIELGFLPGTGVKNSALLTYATSKATALDNFPKGHRAIVPNYYISDEGMWLCADFPVAYDPCTCDLGKNANGELTPNLTILRVVPRWVTTSEITLTGIIAEPAQPITAAGVPQNNANGFSAMLEFGKNALANGQKVYNSASGFITGIENGLKIFKTPPVKSDSVKKDTKTKEAEVKLPPFIKQLSGIGYAYGVLEFLSTGGRTSTTSKNQAPAVKEYKATFTGNSITTGDLSGGLFYTPGSPNETSAQEGILKPTYNNTLGVFNLLDTPTLEYVEYNSPDKLWDIEDAELTMGEKLSCLNTNYVMLAERPIPVIRQYKLKNPIRYAVNPAANLDLLSVEAAWVYKINDATARPVSKTLTPAAQPNPTVPADKRVCAPYIRPAFIGPPLTSRIDPVKTYSNIFNLPLVYKTQEEILVEAMDKSGVFIESWPKDNPNDSEGTNDFRKVLFSSLYTSPECLGGNSFLFSMYKGGNQPTAYVAYEPEIYLKLKVILRPKNATPETENVILVLTFNTKNEPHETAFHPANTYRLAIVPAFDQPQDGELDVWYRKQNKGGLEYMTDFWVENFTSVLRPGNLAFNPGFYGIPNEVVLDANSSLEIGFNINTGQPAATVVAINKIIVNDGFSVPDDVKLTLIAG